MISDDDLQRIVLGNTPEGRVLARVLKRLAALEAAQAKTSAKVERLERAFLDLWIMQEACAGRSASDPHYAAQSCNAYNIARNNLDPIASAIANDLADTDRNQPPKE